MNKFIVKLPNMDVETFEKELAALIDIWLLQHIITEDRKITSSVKKFNS
jgi:hemerythrin